MFQQVRSLFFYVWEDQTFHVDFIKHKISKTTGVEPRQFTLISNSGEQRPFNEDVRDTFQIMLRSAGGSSDSHILARQMVKPVLDLRNVPREA